MAFKRSWQRYHPTYRAQEMSRLASWILAGVSGSIVGMGGAGKSNLMRFLCDYPNALDSYLPHESESVMVIEVDLNNLPSNDLATFCRVILRSFYESRVRFDAEVQAIIRELYRENRASLDPFLSQSALRELLLYAEEQTMRVVLVLDRFDKFYESVTPELSDTLRGLRDRFKYNLSYIVGMRQEVVYLPNPQRLGELYEILDTHVCWVGPMNEADARRMISEETRSDTLNDAQIKHLLNVTGAYPALLKAACHCWTTSLHHLPDNEWVERLLAKPSIQYRLREIWEGLTQEEQLALSELQTLQAKTDSLVKRGTLNNKKTQKVLRKQGQDWAKAHRHALERLQMKGLCQQEPIGWRIFSDLFAAHIANMQKRGRGKIWLDHDTQILYQGQKALDNLAPKERTLLLFFVKHPRIRHTHTDLIAHGWSDIENFQGVSSDALFKVISELRKKIEPKRSKGTKPSYIVNWRGKPGGYQFFPEGRPAT